jgi:hypothetical protein
MHLPRIKTLAVIAAIVVICSSGVLGSAVAYQEEMNHQMHGVEPGPEATRALIREAVLGFVAGAMIGGGALVLFGAALMFLRQRSAR